LNDFDINDGKLVRWSGENNKGGERHVEDFDKVVGLIAIFFS
jgi:hypothetical protein